MKSPSRSKRLKWQIARPIPKWKSGVYVVHVCGGKFKGIYEVYETDNNRYGDIYGLYARVGEKIFTNYKAGLRLRGRAKTRAE